MGDVEPPTQRLLAGKYLKQKGVCTGLRAPESTPEPPLQWLHRPISERDGEGERGRKSHEMPHTDGWTTGEHGEENA